MTIFMRGRFFGSVLCILLVLSATLLFAQEKTTRESSRELSTLLEQIYRAMDPSYVPTNGGEDKPDKCGFSFQFQIRNNWRRFSSEEQDIIKNLFSRPIMQTSILSPSGHFRIHYDTTGIHTPALLDQNGNRIPNTAAAYADSVAGIFDFVWNFEVDGLGYPAPPSDAGAGGGNEYDIYIREFSGAIYGQTIFNPEDLLTPNRINPLYTTFIEIDNDFQGYFSPAMQSLKVTAAHEFHHAIQIGNYGFWSNDIYYYEITSTWMEDVVYDDVNDYYQYLNYYFNNTTLPFNLSNGRIEYGRAVWGKFIEKRFHRDTMRRTWEYMITLPSLPSIDVTLHELGSSFVREFAEFSLWHFYTARRADSLDYFTESKHYPEVGILTKVDFTPPTAQINNIARNLSSQFYQIIVNADTVTLILTNTKFAPNEPVKDQKNSFVYNISNTTTDNSYTPLENGLKVKLDVTDPSNWKSIAVVNTNVSIQSDNVPYPNPFVVNGLSTVNLPVDTPPKTPATLYIYSSSMELIYKETLESFSRFGKSILVWNGKNSNGEIVKSGVYLYFITTRDEQYKGKIAILRQ